MAPDDLPGPQPGAVPLTAEDLGYRPFDADNHYYEALDAFTRHVDPRMQPRVDMGGRKHHLVGGRLARAVANPTWDPIARPGALRDYFKGFSDADRRAIMLDNVAHLNEPQPTPAWRF